MCTCSDSHAWDNPRRPNELSPANIFDCERDVSIWLTRNNLNDGLDLPQMTRSVSCYVCTHSYYYRMVTTSRHIGRGTLASDQTVFGVHVLRERNRNDGTNPVYLYMSGLSLLLLLFFFFFFIFFFFCCHFFLSFFFFTRGVFTLPSLPFITFLLYCIAIFFGSRGD